MCPLVNTLRLCKHLLLHPHTLALPSLYSSHTHTLTTDEPTEEEGGGQAVPYGAGSAGRVVGAVGRLLSAGKAGEQAKDQPKHTGHYQVDRDIFLPGTVIQVHSTCEGSNPAKNIGCGSKQTGCKHSAWLISQIRDNDEIGCVSAEKNLH